MKPLLKWKKWDSKLEFYVNHNSLINTVAKRKIIIMKDKALEQCERKICELVNKVSSSE